MKKVVGQYLEKSKTEALKLPALGYKGQYDVTVKHVAPDGQDKKCIDDQYNKFKPSLKLFEKDIEAYFKQKTPQKKTAIQNEYAEKVCDLGTILAACTNK